MEAASLFCALFKINVDFKPFLIFVPGTRLLENAITFSSCVGGFEDVKNQCPAGEARQARPRRHAVSRRLGGRPRKAKCLERKSTTIVFHQENWEMKCMKIQKTIN
jgi:hypothetical protein